MTTPHDCFFYTREGDDAPTIIDFFRKGTNPPRSDIEGETLEELRKRYPGAEYGRWEEIHAAREQSYISAPKPITHAQYWEWLGCLPPCKWTHRGGAASFHISELTYGSIATICVCIGNESDENAGFFALSDHITLTHDERVQKVRAWQAAQVPA